MKDWEEKLDDMIKDLVDDCEVLLDIFIDRKVEILWTEYNGDKEVVLDTVVDWFRSEIKRRF